MLNTERVGIIADALGDLNQYLVYVGGAVVEMYIENPELAEIRPTLDIDCVIKLESKKSFWEFEEKLRSKGFINDQTPGAPICRWVYKGEKVDIMPDDPNILGFSNRWYQPGMTNKKKYKLPNGREIYIFDEVYFLATKIEAVNDRGGDDWRGASDFEDIVSILYYSKGIIDKIKAAPKILQHFITEEFAKMIKRSIFREEVGCALPYDEMDQSQFIIDIMEEVASL